MKQHLGLYILLFNYLLSLCHEFIIKEPLSFREMTHHHMLILLWHLLLYIIF